MKKYNKKDSISYALGATLTIELLKNKLKYVRKIYFHSSLERNDVVLKIEDICKKNNIPIIQSDKAFRILSDKENCYIIGEFEKFETKLEKNKNHVVLVNPSNSGNLGTIIRSMVGFGINNLAIIRPAVDIFDLKTIRASMGAIFDINFMYFDSFSEYEKEYQNNFYPFMLQAKKKLGNVEFVEPFSLIFGNEATGLPQEFLNIGCSVIIAHSKSIDSLNLTIATSIALYEATKENFK